MSLCHWTSQHGLRRTLACLLSSPCHHLLTPSTLQVEFLNFKQQCHRGGEAMPWAYWVAHSGWAQHLCFSQPLGKHWPAWHSMNPCGVLGEWKWECSGELLSQAWAIIASPLPVHRDSSDSFNETWQCLCASRDHHPLPSYSSEEQTFCWDYNSVLVCFVLLKQTSTSVVINKIKQLLLIVQEVGSLVWG